MKQSTLDRLNQMCDYIKDFSRQNGYPPTVREIQGEFSIKSTASVSYYLNLMEQNGMITKTGGKNRSARLVSDETTAVDFVPVIGDIAAGTPILAQENVESHFPVPEGYFGRGADCFILTVKGESMIDIGINNGDMAIIRRQNTAENGEIAAVLVGNEATLKRFYREKDHFRLKPENSAMQDIITDTAEIMGIAVGLIRKF